MDIFKMMQNIRGINVEEEIYNSISCVKNGLIDLTRNQTCAIYSGHLFEEMRKRHLNARLINTLDLSFSFEHYFILVNGEGVYYIADLTYEQFNSTALDTLELNGYMKIDDNILNQYLSVIERKQVSGFTCSDLYYMEITDKDTRNF